MIRKSLVASIISPLFITPSFGQIPASNLPRPVIVASCKASTQGNLIEDWQKAFYKPLPSRPTTKSVTAFGAVPNDTIDDTAAIQKAVNAASAGMTVSFPAGVYIVTVSIIIKPNVSYVGPGQLKRSNTRAIPIFKGGNLSGIVVSGITFNRGGIRLSGTSKGALIQRNRFMNINDSTPLQNGAVSGIFNAGKMEDANIIGNVFYNIGYNGTSFDSPGEGIFIYAPERMNLIGNRFINNKQGISYMLQDRTDIGNNLLVDSNVSVNTGRMGIELWGQPMNNSVVSNNCVKHGLYGEEDYALSIVGRGTNNLVTKNLAIQTDPTKCGTSTGIEGAGFHFMIKNNTLYGHWCSSISVYNERGWYYEITGNYICGWKGEYPAIDIIGGWSSKDVVSNNTIVSNCPPL